MIKAWLIHPGEPLPIDGPVRLLRYGVLAEMLTNAGHMVTQWGTTFAHSEKRQRSSRDKSIQLNDYHTIQLMRTGGYQKNRSLARLRYLRDQARAFTRCARSLSSPDIILVSMPSPGMCRAVLDYAGPLDIPVVVDVRDLWPDIFLDMVPKPCAPLLRFLLRPASWANQKIFERATAIIAISEQYLGWGLLHSGRDRRDTDRVFPMGYPALSESEAERRTAEKLWVERGVKADSFVCSFIGTISRHFDFGPVIECARKMPDVQFIICGKGDDLARVQRLSHGLDNVLLPGWVDKAQIISLMKLSDVGLAPYSTKARMSLPNKVFEYFFGGLPVVSSLRGELEALLTENQCGVLYDPTNKNDLYRQLHQLVANPVGVREMGERAKRLYEDRFSSNLIYSELISYLESLARSRGGNLKLSHNSGK